MAYLVRLATGLLLVLCAVMIWSPAHASFPATPDPTACTVSPCYEWKGTSWGDTGWLRKLPACQSDAAKAQAASTVYNYINPRVAAPDSDLKCYFDIVLRSNGASAYPNSTDTMSRQLRTVDPAYTCPANSTLSGSTCTCNTNFGEVNGACVPQQDIDNKNCKELANGLNVVGAPLMHYGAVGLTACFGGYVVEGSGGAGGGGQSELYGPFKCSGLSASLCAVATKPQDITANCALGAYPGTVNGVQVCIPPTNTVEAPKETTALPPTPGASAPQVPGAPSGTTTVNETTKCDKGVCETTKDFKDSTGTSLGKVTDTKSQAARCAESPKSPGCEALEASSFGGSCDGGFTYKGDAIQGAIAKEIYKQNCLMNSTSEESDLYNEEKIKTGNRTLDLPGNEVVNVSSSNFDQSNALGVGPACIGDKSIVVMGSSISLPFSNICPWLENLGMVLMALSALLSARIVTRG